MTVHLEFTGCPCQAILIIILCVFEGYIRVGLVKWQLVVLNTLCHCLCATQTSTLAYYFHFHSFFSSPPLWTYRLYGDGHRNHDKRLKKKDCRMSIASKSLPNPPEYHYSEGNPSLRGRDDHRTVFLLY